MWGISTSILDSAITIEPEDETDGMSVSNIAWPLGHPGVAGAATSNNTWTGKLAINAGLFELTWMLTLQRGLSGSTEMGTVSH